MRQRNDKLCVWLVAVPLCRSARRIRRAGIGAPVLPELDSPLENARKQFLIPEKIFYSLTAVLEFKVSEARLAIKDPLISDRISVAGRDYPLAADLSIGTAALLAKDRPQRLGFIRNDQAS